MQTLPVRVALVLSLVAPAFPQSASPTTVTINLAKSTAKVSPTLYGLMTEEINFSYDGGLYGELVSNRVFRDQTFTNERRSPVHWSLVEKGEAAASMSVDKNTGPSAALTNSLKIVIEKADSTSPAGVQNEGYWGIPLRAGTDYQCSFYAKADSPSVGQSYPPSHPTGSSTKLC